ncbi:hypothetical protein KDL01_28540 [Actinospica durhamensis]|uniref:Uncharacterized protein n=1 Tax=Actinospica durhamensis TaxID=1508375 RepID=A0A941ERU9_9ACTN|nr:hypothetical protein [Actinospica durhamensis]MBR7837260.1 hypothetical protein [Actinospica durhamensis]
MAGKATNVSVTQDSARDHWGGTRVSYHVSFYSVPAQAQCSFSHSTYGGIGETNIFVSMSGPKAKTITLRTWDSPFKVGKVTCQFHRPESRKKKWYLTVDDVRIDL